MRDEPALFAVPRMWKSHSSWKLSWSSYTLYEICLVYFVSRCWMYEDSRRFYWVLECLSWMWSVRSNGSILESEGCEQQSNEQADTFGTKNRSCKPILKIERDSFVVTLLTHHHCEFSFFLMVTLIPYYPTFAIRCGFNPPEAIYR